MTNTGIPAEAVQAARVKLEDMLSGWFEDPDAIRQILKVAAPHIQVAVLESAADAIEEDPYDDLDPFYAGWLRDRARKIKEGE